MTILGVKLQMLMREPVLPDKINEHFKFCVYASELIEMATGKVLAEHWSPMARLSTLKKVRRLCRLVVYLHVNDGTQPGSRYP